MLFFKMFSLLKSRLDYSPSLTELSQNLGIFEIRFNKIDMKVASNTEIRGRRGIKKSRDPCYVSTLFTKVLERYPLTLCFILQYEKILKLNTHILGAFPFDS